MLFLAGCICGFSLRKSPVYFARLRGLLSGISNDELPLAEEECLRRKHYPVRVAVAHDVLRRVAAEEAAVGCTESRPPMNIIYQTAEDGLADTVKPRLTALGADCSKVLVIDESERELTLSDRRLAQAIQETDAGLFVLDPIQAYLGDGVDMHRANEVRPIFKRLGQLAEQTGCAIVLVGHMNKMQGVKSAYRGLGSIDFRAAARSVLLVGRSKDDEQVRVVVHDKSSLAPEGKSILFSLHSDTGFSWSGFCDTTANELLSGSGPSITKTEQAERLLLELLKDGEVASEELVRRSTALGISERTLKIAKQNQGVVSVRRGERWYARLSDPGQEGKGVTC